jgi:hypothetical protein
MHVNRGCLIRVAFLEYLQYLQLFFTAADNIVSEEV